MLAIAALTLAGVLVGPGPATATATAGVALPVLTQSHDVGTSTVTWEEPASEEAITGYSVQVDPEWTEPVLFNVADPRELNITWGEGEYTLSSPSLGVVAAGTGSSVLLHVAATMESGLQPAVATLVSPSGVPTESTPNITVLSRVGGNVELQLTTAGNPAPAIRDWIVVVVPTQQDFGLPGGEVRQGATSETDNSATVTVSGLPESGDLQIFAKGRPSTDDSSATGHTDWGSAVSLLEELTATPVPTISGGVVVGSTLSISAGSWEPAPVLLTYGWLRNGEPISGATESAYVLTSADEGAVITALVTGTKAGYTSVIASSLATPAVAAGIFSAAPAPTIAGTPKVGVKLTATTGTWAPAPDTFAYQWLRAGTAIAGATGAAYTPTPADLGGVLSVRVTAAKAGYASMAKTSSPAPAVLIGTLTASTPTISGTTKIGSTLTSQAGAWGPAPVSLTYQWFRSGTAITGATASTYVPSASDLGTVLTVRTTGTKPGFTSVSKTSTSTSVIGLGALTAPSPIISGSVRVGQRLTAAAGTWAPAPVSVTYQWYRGGTAITGSTASTYALTSSDLGASMTVKVTGRKLGYATTTKSSTATVAVAHGLITPATPVITGALRVGSTVTAVPGIWTPTPAAFAYQWYRNGVAVTGATTGTFALTTYDFGKTITVRVAGSKAGYLTAAKTSFDTAAVGPGLLSTATPKISGTLKVGYSLAASAGTWGPGTVAMRYQWKRAGIAITGATAATYNLTGSDAGKAITVEVTGSKTAYASVTRVSAATTAIVQGTLSSAPVPTITGTAKVGNRLTANAGAWAPAPVTLQYQWYRSGSPISGASSATYVLTSSDVSKTVTVKVTGRKTGYGSVVMTSAPTAAVTISIRISGDGTRLVPSEVPRNIYVTTSKTTDFCYWETNSGYNGSLITIVDNSFGNGQRIMEIASSAVTVETDRCGSWIRLADMPTSRRSSIAGDGIWSVGKQIVPGIYRASTDGSDGCYWAISSDFTSSFSSIIENDFTYSPNPVVQIFADDVSFESSYCGSWTRIG